MRFRGRAVGANLPRSPWESSLKKVLNVGGNSKAISLPPEYATFEHVLLDIDPRTGADVVCDARELTTLADQVVLKRLQTVRGVGQAYIVGGLKRRINVLPNPEKMQSYGVGMDQLINVLKAENQQIPLGTLTRPQTEFVVQIEGRVIDPHRLSELVVARRGGASVTMGDIATVEDGSEEKEAVALFNGDRQLAISFVRLALRGLRGAGRRHLSAQRADFLLIERGGLRQLGNTRGARLGEQRELRGFSAQLIDALLCGPDALLEFLTLNASRLPGLLGLTLRGG